MGQRTNIILVSKDTKGNGNVKVYHNQWGIGRRMPLALMSLFNGLYNNLSKVSYEWYHTNLKDIMHLNEKDCDISLEYEFNYDSDGNLLPQGVTEMPCEMAFDDWKDNQLVGSFIDLRCDNNNGAMVVFCLMDDNGEPNPDVDLKIGFLLGHEDEDEAGKAYEKWLSPEEYMSLKINSGYSDEGFQYMFRMFLEYFEIEYCE